MTVPGVLFAALLVFSLPVSAQDETAPAPQAEAEEAAQPAATVPLSAGPGGEEVGGDSAGSGAGEPVAPEATGEDMPPQPVPDGGEPSATGSTSLPGEGAGSAASASAPVGPPSATQNAGPVVSVPSPTAPNAAAAPRASVSGAAAGAGPPGTAAVEAEGEVPPAPASPEPSTALSADTEEASPASASGETPPDPMASTPREQALYDRLLGADERGPGVELEPPASGLDIEAPTVPGWLWVVGGVGGVALVLLRSRSLKALRGPDAISVVSRSQLGKDGSLAVIEVAEADGEKRRLLVGFGGGAPRLVADLGRPFPDAPEAFIPLAPAPLVDPADARGSRPRGGATGEGPPPIANAANAWARAVRDSGGPGPAPGTRGRLERRHDLIEEVLAEREEDDVRGVSG